MAADTSKTSSSGAAADFDLQAVEAIPKDTLVALLRRKDKDAKALAAKLEKLEERYVKVVRFNKILMEDRTSFLRFCNELLPESDGAFEEAAAQEIPVNLEALLRRLGGWRSALEAATTDRRYFQQFTELVFPGDEEVAQAFERPALDEEAFDTLQKRWVALEDLHNQSIASINAMARDQMLSRAKEHEAALEAKQEAERHVEELQGQLTRFARERAQVLTQRLKDGGPADFPGSESRTDGSSLGLSVAPAQAGPSEEVLRELREARDAAEQRALKASDAAAERERELREALDLRQCEAQRLQREYDCLREDSERQRAQSRRLLEEKDKAHDALLQKTTELEKEHNSLAFISRLAEQQAGRDVELKNQKRQVEDLNKSMLEVQKMLTLSYQQERTLKERIRELEASQGRGHVASDYLKHVILKYVQYTQRGDLKAQSLVPVISTLLNLSPEENKSIEEPVIPQTFLIINQAVGQAATLMRGDPSRERVEPPPDMPIPGASVGVYAAAESPPDMDGTDASPAARSSS